VRFWRSAFMTGGIEALKTAVQRRFVTRKVLKSAAGVAAASGPIRPAYRT